MRTSALIAAATAAALAFSVPALAKGPKGPHGNSSNAGFGGPSFTPGTPQGLGVQGGGWTSPPGWSSEGNRQGWNGGSVPRGFGTASGNTQGWQGQQLPPGLYRHAPETEDQTGQTEQVQTEQFAIPPGWQNLPLPANAPVNQQ